MVDLADLDERLRDAMRVEARAIATHERCKAACEAADAARDQAFNLMREARGQVEDTVASMRRRHAEKVNP